ncbi:hypothetical protein ACHAPJ_011069 [Fusarium lateritium]
MSGNIEQTDQADLSNGSGLMSIDAPSVTESIRLETGQEAPTTTQEAQPAHRESEIRRLLAENESLRAEKANAISLEDCIESLRTQVDRLAVEVSTDPNDAQNRSLRHTIGQLRDEIRSHKDTIRQLKKDQTATGKELQAKDKQIEKHNNQLEVRDTKIKEWTANCKDLEKKNREAAQSLSREKDMTLQVDVFKSGEIARLQTQLEQLKNTLGEKEVVIESLQRDLDSKQPNQTADTATQTAFRSTHLSRLYQMISDHSLRLPLDDHVFSVKDIGNFALALGHAQYRQNLSSFVYTAAAGNWCCLVAIVSGSPFPVAVATSQGWLRCPLHTHTGGIGCTFLIMTQVDGVKKLRVC